MFAFTETTETLEYYIREMKINDPARIEEMKKADIILLPDLKYRKFWSITDDFLKYLNQSEFSIDFCYPKKGAAILCSDSLNISLPTIITTTVFLPLLLNIISGFVFDWLKRNASKREWLRKKGFDVPEKPNVEFKIIVNENERSKTITFNGTSKTLAECFEKIDLNKLFNGESAKD